jgi:hypothetical protein
MGINEKKSTRMRGSVLALLAMIAATPAWAAKPDAAALLPKLVEAQAACDAGQAHSEVEIATCSLSATETIWRTQDLDPGMQKALSDYRQETLTIAQAADARTISDEVLIRRRARAEQALRQAVFGRAVKVTDPGLDPSRMPTREDLVQMFPVKASAEKRNGQARMACRVMQDGVLSACRIVSEIPPGYGFGQAAIALSKLLKGKPATLDGQPIGGAEIRFALDFDPAWL